MAGVFMNDNGGNVLLANKKKNFKGQGRKDESSFLESSDFATETSTSCKKNSNGIAAICTYKKREGNVAGWRKKIGASAS